MLSEEKQKALEEANPGSIDGPAKYLEAYNIYHYAPKRFGFIYGKSIRGIRHRKGIKHVGVFAHEVSLFPEKGMPKDIAYDLKAAHDFTIQRGEIVKVMTGAHLVMPDLVYASVRGRSGLSLKGIDVLAGVIDPQYRGEIGVTLSRSYLGSHQIWRRNTDGNIFPSSFVDEEEYTFKKGDRIAQLIFVPSNVWIYPIFEIEKIPQTDRGEKGYGSTGNHSRETKEDSREN